MRYAHVPHPALRCLVAHVPHTSQAFLRYVPCALRAVIHLITLHTIMHLKSCGFVSLSSYAFGVLAIRGFFQFILRLVAVIYNFY